MPDQETIDRLTDLFNQIWTILPDMRMAQLMYLLTDPGFNDDKNMFFESDADFEDRLKKVLAQKKI